MASAHTAVAGAGISGSDVRDMMLATVEGRFGTDRAPHPVEPLSDNGSYYTTKGEPSSAIGPRAMASATSPRPSGWHPASRPSAPPRATASPKRS